MGVNPRYRCPWCNSSDKERLVWRYLTTRTDVLTTKRPLSILHIAPERNTKNKLSARPNIRYVAGDKFEGAAKYTPEHYGGAKYLDVTDLSQYDDGSFDVVICNHVLEHVEDDRKAMGEIHRVLSKEGFAILQVPVSRIIEKSIEDENACTEEERTQKFGQADHVRIYAENDYKRRLVESGLAVESIAPENLFGSESEILRFGVNKVEHIYVARHRAPESL